VLLGTFVLIGKQLGKALHGKKYDDDESRERERQKQVQRVK
jgi:hypothetical protein